MARGNAANAALGETPDAWMYSLCDQKVSRNTIECLREHLHDALGVGE